MRVRLRTLSNTRTRPSRTVTEVPSQRRLVSHRVPIEPALTEPVTVRQRPPRSDTHRRLRRRLRRDALAVGAAAEAKARPAVAARAPPAAQPVRRPRRNSVNGREPESWRMVKSPEKTL